MKTAIKFLLMFFKSLLLKNKRYIRITPFKKGKIYFFDKAKKSFFSVFVREKIDSITADEVFLMMIMT